MTPSNWIDTHIHVSDRGSDGGYREHLLEDLLNVLDAEDPDLRVLLSPDGYWNRICRDEPDGCGRANAFIHGLVEGAPERLYGSCIVNPNFVDESLRTMETCFEKWGFVQLGEMLQYMLGFRMDSDATETLVHRAVEYDVPVQVHISTSNSAQGGFSGGIEELENLFGLVDRVPEAKYILAHAVGSDRDDPPVIDEYVDRIERQYEEWPRTFWAEIRDFSSPGLPSALRRIPPDRLIAGTDWTTRIGPPFMPYGMIFAVPSPDENPYPPCIASMVTFVREAGATDETIRKIAFENAARLLKLQIDDSSERTEVQR